MISILPLSRDNFDDFLSLLCQRGECPIEYYEWKYLQQPYDFFPTGFVAYDSGMPIGCIGNINKIFIDAQGNEHKATWFADWFVSKQARGKGVGESLIKCIYDLSDYGCGIPGPEKAQKIAQQAGYLPMHVCTEVTTVLNPFSYGFKIKRDKNIFSKLTYGFYLGMHSANFKKLKIHDLKLIFSKPSESHLQVAYHNLPEGLPRFKRDIRALNWLTDIPVAGNKNFRWWYISDQSFFVFGIVEEQSNGLRVAKIFECLSNFSESDALLKVLGMLSNSGIDGVKFVHGEISNTMRSIRNIKQINLPFHVSNLGSFGKLHLSIIDKESAWINLRFQ